jgi:hypothetical protein
MWERQLAFARTTKFAGAILDLICAYDRHYKLLVVLGGFGACEWGRRIRNLCRDDFGWECRTLVHPPSVMSELAAFGVNIINGPVNDFRPDLVVSLRDPVVLRPEVPHYLAASAFVDPDLSRDLPQLQQMAGFLCASTYGIGGLRHHLHTPAELLQGKDRLRWAWFYPTCAARPYKPWPNPTELRQLFYCGCQWDKKRSSDGFRRMFAQLDETGYFNVYGPVDKWAMCPKSKRGLLPFDGTAVIDAIQQCGIALILHTDRDLVTGAPTSRIFEAAAASAVIICDRHPFVVQHFGNAVLYLNVTATSTAEELFEQITTYVDWIDTHPRRAEAMAERCNHIFNLKFTLERMMNNLADLHEQRSLSPRYGGSARIRKGPVPLLSGVRRNSATA